MSIDEFISIEIQNDNVAKTIELKDILYVPELRICSQLAR